MKLKLATSCFVIGALFAPLAAFAADSDSAGAKSMTYVKDSVITTKIKAKLAAEKMSSLTNIQVDTDREGVVVLSGHVKTQAEENTAITIARGTEGVTAVKSKIQIKKDD